MSTAPPKRNVLVTFDIDGTLLGKRAGAPNLGNSGHKRCIERAVKDVFDVSCRVDSVPHAGSTDREIVRRMVSSMGVSDADAWAGMDRVVALCAKLIPGFIEDSLVDCVLPGVPELLSALKEEHNVYMGLVTGNFSTIGWDKMRVAGLGAFLAEGLDQPSAFGSDRAHRSDILALAVERAEARGFCKEMSDGGECVNVYHVGDAVADMEAAAFVSARGVGVLTGSFTRADLEPQKPFVVLPDLRNTAEVLKILGL